MRTTSRCISCLLLAALSASFSGCKLLHSNNQTPKANDSVSSGDNSMSQLGTALPAMKPGDERELNLHTGIEMAKNGYWNEAVEHFRRAEALDARKPKLDKQLAPALASTGQYSESVDRYKRLIDKNPKDAELHLNLGWTLMEMGDLHQAEAEMRKAIELNPSLPTSAVNLATVVSMQHRYEEAFDILLPVLGESAAHHNLGVIAIQNGDQEYALSELNKAAAAVGDEYGSLQLARAYSSDMAQIQSQ